MVDAERFEAARPRLQRIAHRILGSTAESDDALQESWLRISRADVTSVTNLDGWLTTVVARICLDALKRRRSRREELTPEAARQLASRARRRVRGASEGRNPATQRRDELVRAFLAASRVGNFSALLALLDPGATLRVDATILAMGGAAYWQSDRLETGIVGADTVARTFAGRARAAQPAFLDGEPGAVWMHEGKLQVAFRFTIGNDRITGIDLVADPLALAQLDVSR